MRTVEGTERRSEVAAVPVWRRAAPVTRPRPETHVHRYRRIVRVARPTRVDGAFLKLVVESREKSDA